MNKTLAAIATSVMIMSPVAAHAVTEPYAQPLGGKVYAGGQKAMIEASLICPKGDRWKADMTIILAEVGRDDSAARTEQPATGTCTGRTQIVKLKLTAFDNPPLIRNCSAEYWLTFEGSSGWSLVYGIGGADEIPNSPNFCLV